jgi:hypothetical protein
MRLQLAGLSLAVTISSAAGQKNDPAGLNGLELLAGCKNHLEQMSPSTPMEIVYTSGICAGKVSILARTGTMAPPNMRFCPPDTGTVTQAVRVVVKYLNDHPERLHEPFDNLALDGLRGAWPCK